MEANLDCLRDQMKANMDDKIFEYHIECQNQEKGVYFFSNSINIIWKISLKWFQGNIEAHISVLSYTIPPKNNSTPINPSKSYTIMH